jgi:protein-S-isoprenylcysteine O-methyltransferase Ste14
MSLVFGDPMAAALFWATYAAVTAVDARLILRSLSGRERRPSSERQGAVHRPSGLIGLLAVEGAGIAAAGVDQAVLPHRWLLLFVGVGIAWIGLGLRAWAKHTLGRFFVGAVVIQPDHRVVTDGPYARIRHPGYLGAIVTMTGLGLATGNAISIALFIVGPIVVFTRTITVEEAVLSTRLRDSYATYQRRTWRLVPGIW